ncbi:hypothetical protein [Candidatus Vidania fulgoroideorum]
MIYNTTDILRFLNNYNYKSVISYSNVSSSLIQKIRLLCFPSSKIIFLKNNVISRLLKDIVPFFNPKGNNFLFLTNNFFLIKSLFLINYSKFTISLLLSNGVNISRTLIDSLLLYSNITDIYIRLCFLLRNKILYFISLLKNIHSVNRKNI